ncbi:MAG: outer membrane lipoprotein carrier protein LolA [Calditrichaeota bacterium]|nr:outer membrane lipoprotein carrier protein LolA [Calditrichota bacterium]
MRTKIIIGFIVLIAINTVFAIDVKDIIKKLQKKYDDIENFKATFEKVETFQLTGSVSKTEGTLYVKDGKKYRFETEDQLIVSDGKTVWTYNRINNQVLIDRVRKNSGVLLPRDILFKYPKTHYATLLGEDKIRGKKVYVVKLDPKEDVHGYFSSLKVWIQDHAWQIVKIEITDLNGNKSIFNLSNIDTKNRLADSLFSFTPTSEMNVVDMRQ